jgi:hypothetical protein
MKLESILDPAVGLRISDLCLGPDNLCVFNIASQFGACFGFVSWSTRLLNCEQGQQKDKIELHTRIKLRIA